MSETTLLHQESSETTASVHYDLNGDVFEPPNYTMQQIRAAIPSHCFHPSTFRSLSYVVRDFALVSILVYIASTYIMLISDVKLRFAAWAAYTVCQGMVGTGIWILAHECGHGAFSKHKWLNNVMGLLMHSFLLVPFHSWRLSHAKHHKGTGNLQRDMVFIPRSRERWISQHKVHNPHGHGWHLVEETPVVTLGKLVFQQLFGFPLYLLINVAGQKYPGSWWVKRSHFYFGGGSYIFDRKDWGDILISDLGIATALATLWAGTKYFGAWNAFVFYIIPYLWVHHWIVALTYLQHTDPSLPHYENSAWTFSRGAAATIDRDFGFIGRHIFHRIIETHVLHHHVSTIPFYYAEEASEAIKKVMGVHYKSDTKTGFLVALWKVARSCRFVEESVKDSGVVFYRNFEGVGKVRPRRLSAKEL
ncbi:MAG: hypothetical protein M1840_008343 [Geoglossum simile]|nr:MAG: hypothetical protein M1840_008343 [Geoglossum simile]